MKQQDYISWDNIWAFAFPCVQKDNNSQVGAYVLSSLENKRFTSPSANDGMPIGCNDDDMPWEREGEDLTPNSYMYVCHSELNAILEQPQP